MSRLDDLLKEREKSRENSALSSRSKSGRSLDELLAEREYKKFSNAYNSGYEALQGVYGGWNTKEAMEGYRNKLTEANQAMSDYLNTYNVDDSIREAYKNFSKAYEGFDQTAKVYSTYKNADAFNKAKKNAELTKKYKGASYDKIQRALSKSKDQEEVEFLKGYTDYSSVEDFDKALANASLSEKEREALQGKRSNFAKFNAFDEYKGLMKNADFRDNINKDAILAAEDEVFMQSLQGGKLSPLAKSIADRSITSDNYDTVPFNMLSPEMQDVGAYIFNTQGEEAYKDFMRKIAIQASADINKEQSEEYTEFSTKNPLTGTLATVANAISTPGLALGSGLQAVADFAKGVDYNPYSGVSGAQRMINESQSAMAQEIEDWGGKIPEIAYNAVSVGAVSRLGQRMFGPFYNVVIGSGAFAQEYGDALNSGLSEEKAMEKAVVSGAIEALTEQIGMDWAFKEGKTAIKTIINQFLAEGSEEVVGSLSNLIYDLVRNGSESEFNQNREKYESLGYSKAQAFGMAAKDFALEVGEAFVTAGLSAGAEGGVHSIATAREGSAIDTESFKNAMEDLGEGSKVYGDYKQMLNSEGNLSNWQKGSLYNRALNEVNEDYKQAKRDFVDEAEGGEWESTENAQSEALNRAERAVQNYNRIANTKNAEAAKASKAVKTGEKNTVKGKEAEIISMKENKDGTFTIKTSEGEFDSKDVTVTPDKATALSYSANIENEEFKEAYVHYYGGEDIADYDTYARYLYEAGKQGIDFSDQTQILDTLGVAKARAIYNVGAKQALEEEIADNNILEEVADKYAETNRPGTFSAGTYTNGEFAEDEDFFRKLNRTQKKLHRIVEAFSKLSGINVRVYIDRAAASQNGEFISNEEGGTVYINLAARPFADNAYGMNQYVISTLSHELTHWLKFNNREAYNVLEEAVKKSLTKKGTLEKHISKEKEVLKKNGFKGNIDEVALEEVVARACEDMLNNSDTMQEILSNADQDGLTKLQEAIKKWFDHIKEFFNDLMGGFRSPNEISNDLQDSYAHIRELWTNGMKEAISRSQKATSVKESSSVESRNSIKMIVGEDGTNYGMGVYLDYAFSENASEEDKRIKVRERIRELGGQSFTAYDNDGNAVEIKIAEPGRKFKKGNGDRVDVNKDLITKSRKETKAVKREMVVLSNELIETSRSPEYKASHKSHDWLDNYGKNDWEYWTTYAEDKDGNIWKTILDVANASTGEKILYDIDPIIKEGQAVKSATSLPNPTIPHSGKQSNNPKSVKMDSEEDSVETIGAADVDTKTGTAVYSVRYTLAERYKELGYKSYAEAVGKTAEKIAKQMGVSKLKAEDWIKAEESLSSIILKDAENQRYLDYSADDRYKAIKTDTDYPQGTIDLSNLCRKREIFTKMFDNLQKENPDVLFTAEDIAKIRQILTEANYEVACALCYVEDRRQHIGEIAKSFTENYKNALKSKNKVIYRTNSSGEKKPLIVTEEQASKYGLKKGEPFKATDTYVPNQYDLTTYQGYKDLTEKHPQIAVAFENFNNSRGQSAARLIEGHAEYKREILNWTKSQVDKANKLGGLRVFSFSDFEAIHLIDIVQVVMDCSTKGVMIQAYTKVPSFANLIKNTNIKLNRSLIPANKGSKNAYAYIDGEAVKINEWADDGIGIVDGKEVLAFDIVEGIDITDENFIDMSGNKNVGNILVGINEKQIRMAMESDFIDYIIPFHTNQAKDILEAKGIHKWDNFKLSQLDKKINGKGKGHGINIYTDVIGKYNIKNKKDFVRAFLNECKNQGYKPRFAEFLNTNSKGEYIYTEGYHKFLVDYKLFDLKGNILKQEAVKPDFDQDLMNKILLADKERSKNMKFSKEVMDKVKSELSLSGKKSVKMDSEGRELTKGQANYFKDSKVLDDNGNLKVMYHGSPRAGFTEFRIADDNLSYFFTDKLNVASSYSGVPYVENPDKPLTYEELESAFAYNTDGELKDNGDGTYTYEEVDGSVTETFDSLKKAQAYFFDETMTYVAAQNLGSPSNYAVYLNAKNPLVIDAKGGYWDDIDWATNESDEMKTLWAKIQDYEDNFDDEKFISTSKVTAEEYHEALERYEELENKDYGEDLGTTRGIAQYANAHGYDSVMINNLRDVGGYGTTEDDVSNIVIVFNSNQIKSIYNENPTEDKDIRYSTKMDSSGKELTPGQQKFFKDSKARDDKGRLLRLYHGTGSAGFNVFRVGRSGGIWLTTSRKDAGSYGNATKAYDPNEKQLDVKTVGGNYPVGKHLHFDTEEDRANFLKEYPNAENYMTERELEEAKWDAEEEGDYDRLNELRRLERESDDIHHAYRQYEFAHSHSIKVEDFIKNKEKYSLDDVKRAWLEYDSNAMFDDESEYSEERFRDILAEGLGEALRNNEDVDFDNYYVNARVPVGETSVAEDTTLIHHRIYELYANVKRPYVHDAKGISAEGSGEDYYGVVDKAMQSDEYDGAIIKNIRIGAYKKLGTVVVVKDSSQVKWAGNENPTNDENILKSTKLPPEAQKLVDALTLENKRLTAENTALKMEKGLEQVKAEKNAIINKITENAQTLSRWLLSNDKNNPVPQAVKEPLGKLLTSISFTRDDYEWRKQHGHMTKAEETLGERMAKISSLLREIEQDKVLDADAYDLSQLDWIPEFTNEFEDIKNAIASVEARQGESFKLSKMTTADLQSLSNMITALKSAITNMNKCLSAHNKMSVSGVGQEIIGWLDEVGQKDKDNRLLQFLELDNTTPFYFFKRLGSGGEKTFKLLMDGMDKYAFEAKQIEDYAKEAFSGKDVLSWRDEVKTFEVDQVEYNTQNLVKLEKKTIQMTVPQIMSLYCLSKRDQAVKHLKTGGIKIGDFKVDGKETRQIGNTTLTAGDLNKILSSLTDEQRAVADKLQDFMNTVCQKWGNEVTMKRFGFKGMTEKNYFPISVDRNQLSSEARQKGTSLYQLLNMGFTKPINPKAKNPIEIFDIFEVFAIHSTEMAQYNSLALPVLDVIRIWNYKDLEMLDEEESKAVWHSVKASIENALGKQGNRYIGLLLADLNGDVSGGRADDFASALMKNFKTAAVSVNLQVAMLQPLSYIRAGYMIDSKYLRKGLTMKSSKEALKWCGMAVWKKMGFYNTAIHRGLEHKIMQDDSMKDRLIEKGLWLAGKADEWTWSKLWNACLLETKDKHPDLEGDDLYKKTAERLTGVIYGTQVVDSVLTRSQLMRDKTFYSKMVTAFQSEPTLAFNVLMDAGEQFSMEKRAHGAQAALQKHGATVRRAATVYLLCALAESAFRALNGKIRGYDGDEDDENLLEDFFTRFIEELNPLRKIPIVKDVVNLGVNGIRVLFHKQARLYTDTRMDEEIIAMMAKSVIRIGKLIEGEAPSYKAIYEIARGIDASGLPVSSTFREFKVLWNNTIGRIWTSLALK